MISSLVRTLERSLERWTSPVDPSSYLAALNPRWAGPNVGVIERITPLTATSAAIEIRPGRSWTGHRPGQFVTLGVDVDGVRYHRCYSLTSPPGRTDGRIEIAVQAVAGGIVSSHLVEHARSGDLVHVEPADGDFTLPDSSPARLLFISGGSGITPLMGMIRSLAERGADVPVDLDVVLLHHAPTATRAMFAGELARLNADAPWLTVDTQLTQNGGRRLDAGSLEERCPDWAEREAFVCGPESLLELVTNHWQAHGRIEQLHLERFTPTRLLAVDPSDDGAPPHVTFGASGRHASSTDGATLLEMAESAGLTPPTGCRMGICHTCTTPLLAGCARDLRNGHLIEAGTHVQLCVSAPAGDLTLDL